MVDDGRMSDDCGTGGYHSVCIVRFEASRIGHRQW